MQKEPKAQFWIHMGIELGVNVLEPDPEWELRWVRERQSPDLPMVILINSHGSTTGYTVCLYKPKPTHTATVKIQSTNEIFRGPPPNSLEHHRNWVRMLGHILVGMVLARLPS